MKYFALIIITVLTASSVFAESIIRIRGLQVSPLLSDKAEKGKFKSGSEEVPMSTPPSEYQSVMISYGIFAVGSSSITTKFTFSNKDYSLTSNWMDGALIFNGPGKTSITLGTGISTKGEGLISNQSGILTSDTVTGVSLFGIFAIEYELPLNLDFIGLEFTEVLFGYRENQIEYSNFQNSSSVMRNKLKIKTIHYQFGVGFVF